MHPVLHEIRDALKGYYPDSEALALAKMLLVEVFGFSTLELYGGKDKEFSEKHRSVLTEMIRRLQKNEPIQYIIGIESFFGLTFEVNPNVLIPRPETQELVSWIIEDYQSDDSVRILDIGTGSGCIPISLGKQLSKAEVESWDISEGALEVASRNSERNGVKVLLRHKDVLNAVPEGSFPTIVQRDSPFRDKAIATAKTFDILWIENLVSACLYSNDSPPTVLRAIPN